MEKKEYLIIWGYLQTLKDIFEQRAKDTAAKGDGASQQNAGWYLKECAEIRAMQEKIDREVANLS